MDGIVREAFDQNRRAYEFCLVIGCINSQCDYAMHLDGFLLTSRDETFIYTKPIVCRRMLLDQRYLHLAIVSTLCASYRMASSAGDPSSSGDYLLMLSALRHSTFDNDD